MEEMLIVDGYNIIGEEYDLHRLHPHDLEKARDELVDKLAEYQAFKGIKVYVIFDAHKVPGIGKRMKQADTEIIYTRQNETADECIEKLVHQLRRVQQRIYVATSDYMEQRIILGRGALRMSARELLNELSQMQKGIRATVDEKYHQQAKKQIKLQKRLAEIFEKWRRGE